ncbi:CLUMA_CG000450, isoform A [Clunio marinus]|uniref:CLUMA_CG000450, isoform A n=1 Tax=Clunio marinus TaxID=568069 RepID=A0A1J1HF30_9DIPT|nr:CLUMA_CG000450, isoform A [Clunio marinus]
MTTSINISACFENPQSALISAYQRRNLDAFKYALDHLHADPNAIDPRSNMSIFDKILKTPDSNDYIRLCIAHGADLYSKNVDNRYPLHEVVGSLSPNNLKTFLNYYDPRKINVKYKYKNCLHMLIDLLPSDKYDDIAECIKILIDYDCDPNMPNEKSRTPFFSLLRVQPKLRDPNDLIDYILEHSTVDLYTYKHDEMKRMFEKQNPHHSLPEKVEKIVDADYMLGLLRARKEAEFEVNFKLFKEMSTKMATNDDNKLNNFAEDCAKFLYTAIQNDLEAVVDLLMSEGVDVNKRSVDMTHQRPAAFLACYYGHHGVLKLLLQADPKPETIFKNRNLLHEVCSHFGTDPSSTPNIDHQKCFDLVLDHCNVNQIDESGCTPLHYAVRYRNDKAAKALLERSSYIGTRNSYGETPIDDLSREVLENFLDSRITTNIRRSGDDEQKIAIDYQFLMSPKTSDDVDEFRSEILPLKVISENSDLRSLILHPVLSSFLFLKWSKLSLLFYANLLLFSTFMVSLIVFIVLCQSIPPADRDDSGVYCLFFYLSIISLILLMLREVFQCMLSVKHYFKNPINLLEIILIILGWTVIIQSSEVNDDDDATQRILRAVTILFAAYEFLQLVGTLPILSVSTHMVILKKVAVTFLKSIALYSILLLAFALSFYTLFGGKNSNEKEDETTTIEPNSSAIPSGCCKQDDDDGEFNSFGYPGIAIIKTFVMLTGEFDASSLDLDRNGISYSIIFLLFVFLITIVLFNLLNALAVDDTHVIKSEGQLVDLCQRINVLTEYERIILGRSGWRWVKSIISIFPYTIPQGRIVIHPNRRNEILTMKSRSSSQDVSIKVEDGQEQELQTLNNNSSIEKIIPSRRLTEKLEKYSRMDPKIMKRIRSVLEERNEKRNKQQREETLWDHIRSMELQLKVLTDLIKNRKN